MSHVLDREESWRRHRAGEDALQPVAGSHGDRALSGATVGEVAVASVTAGWSRQLLQGIDLEAQPSERAGMVRQAARQEAAPLPRLYMEPAVADGDTPAPAQHDLPASPCEPAALVGRVAALVVQHRIGEAHLALRDPRCAMSASAPTAMVPLRGCRP